MHFVGFLNDHLLKQKTTATLKKDGNVVLTSALFHQQDDWWKMSRGSGSLFDVYITMQRPLLCLKEAMGPAPVSPKKLCCSLYLPADVAKDNCAENRFSSARTLVWETNKERKQSHTFFSRSKKHCWVNEQINLSSLLAHFPMALIPLQVLPRQTTHLTGFSWFWCEQLRAKK